MDTEAKTNALTSSKVFPFESLTVKKTATGGEGRDVLHGTTATGEAIALHETLLPVGAVPNPAHRIEHSELILVREGAIEFLHDGLAERAEAGAVIFVAKGTLHTLKNVGAVPAQYFVFAIGGDVKG